MSVAIAGKLVGKYASRMRELEGDLERVGATLMEGFDSSADVVVLGAKANGFHKRITKAGCATMSEVELEQVLSGPPAESKPARRRSLVDNVQQCTDPTLSPDERRERLVEALVDASSAGARLGFVGVVAKERFSAAAARPTARELLIRCGLDETEIVALPDDVPSDVRADLNALAGKSFHFGDDCELEVIGAALRTLVRLGHGRSILVERARGEYENRDVDPAFMEAALAELQSTRVSLASQELTRPEELPLSLERVYLLLDQVLW